VPEDQKMISATLRSLDNKAVVVPELCLGLFKPSDIYRLVAMVCTVSFPLIRSTIFHGPMWLRIYCCLVEKKFQLEG